MKQISCGVVIINDNKILACKPYGKKLQKIGYDIPKGHLEEIETYRQCAVRELFEETGIIVMSESLIYQGIFDYSKHKDLALFVSYDKVNIDNCFCNSTFNLADGREVKEIVSYEWISTNELNRFYPNLEKVLKQVLMK